MTTNGQTSPINNDPNKQRLQEAQDTGTRREWGGQVEDKGHKQNSVSLFVPQVIFLIHDTLVVYLE